VAWGARPVMGVEATRGVSAASVAGRGVWGAALPILDPAVMDSPIVNELNEKANNHRKYFHFQENLCPQTFNLIRLPVQLIGCPPSQHNKWALTHEQHQYIFLLFCQPYSLRLARVGWRQHEGNGQGAAAKSPPVKAFPLEPCVLRAAACTQASSLAKANKSFPTSIIELYVLNSHAVSME